MCNIKDFLCVCIILLLLIAEIMGVLAPLGIFYQGVLEICGRILFAPRILASSHSFYLKELSP